MAQPSLSECIQLAKGAGDILRAGYGQQHQVDLKGRIDPVTEIDHASEDFLVGHIRQRYPDHQIMTEESGELRGTSDARWFLDPLDGTTNYAHALPIFAVSVAFALAGQVRLGVIYDPLRDECFSAELGAGAFLNNVPIHPSSTPDLLHSLLVTGFPYDMEVIEGNLKNFAHFSRLTQGVRRLGSAALDLCYVAAGRVDGYWETSLQSYDMAAGALIVREAGGTATSLEGNTDIMQPPYSVLAANPVLHAQMLAELEKQR